MVQPQASTTTGSSTSKKKQQSSLRSFFSKSTSTSASKIAPKQTKDEKEKATVSDENIETKAITKHNIDDDDDDDKNASKENIQVNETSSYDAKGRKDVIDTGNSTTKRKVSYSQSSMDNTHAKQSKLDNDRESSRCKRRVIDDSDSEEDEDAIDEKCTKVDDDTKTTNNQNENAIVKQTTQQSVQLEPASADEEMKIETLATKEENGTTITPIQVETSQIGTKIETVDSKHSEAFSSNSKTKVKKYNSIVTQKSKLSKDNEVKKKADADGKESEILILAMKDNQIKCDTEILQDIPDIWDKSSDMPYTVLCQAFSKIEQITGRLQIQEILTTLIRQIILQDRLRQQNQPSSDSCNRISTTKMTDLHTVLYLASNTVAPAYECVELGIGDAILVKAIGEALGTNANMVKQKYENDGDLGTVAQSFKSKQRTLGGFFTAKTTSATAKKKTYLTATDVLTTFRKIAATKGNQSQRFKVENIKKLLVQASDPEETKYIIRGLQGKLRIGLAQSTVLISLAHALALTTPFMVLENKSILQASEEKEGSYPDEAKQFINKSEPYEKRLEAAVAIVKKAYSEVPSYGTVLDTALSMPLQLLHEVCTLTPGIPVAPMLAKPTKSVKEVLKRLNGLKFTVEYKYDGERAQIHMLQDGTTRVFSRNLLDTSEKYPEVPKFVKEACSSDVQSCVIDAEVVAYNNKTGQLVPFQILSTRKKTEESAETAKVQVIVQAFDLMFFNGKSLLSHTLEQRRALLREHFKAVNGKFQFAKALDHEENGDTAVIEEFLDLAVKGQCEGLMVKTLEVNAIYEPSRRSLNWLKLKKDYLEGLGDSVDLVPLGGYFGKGKRTGVYGAYLLACYDPETEEFQSVCKIGTGFSDEDLQTLSESLNQHKISKKSSQYNVSDQLECDVWFDAVQVWEVKAADLSKSSAHRGAIDKTGEAGRGIGLRFPRFERVRDDKKPDDATTSDQILEMYYQQDALGGNTGGDDDNDDEDGI